LTGNVTKTFSEQTSTDDLHLVGTLGSNHFNLTTRTIPGGLVCSASDPSSCCQPHRAYIVAAGTFAGQQVSGTLTPEGGADVMHVTGTVGGEHVAITWNIPADTCCGQMIAQLTAQVN